MESKRFLFRFAQMFELEKGSPCKPIGGINICWFFGLILERHRDTMSVFFSYGIQWPFVGWKHHHDLPPLKGDHPFGNRTIFSKSRATYRFHLSYVFSSTVLRISLISSGFFPDFFDRKMVWLHHPDKGGDPERCLADLQWLSTDVFF